MLWLACVFVACLFFGLGAGIAAACLAWARFAPTPWSANTYMGHLRRTHALRAFFKPVAASIGVWFLASLIIAPVVLL